VKRIHPYIVVALLALTLIPPAFISYHQVAQAQTTQTTGWLTGWMYRRAVIIDNTANPNTLVDYQVLVVVDTASLISAGKLQDTCADIRFTDSDGVTLLSYWIESGCNTTSTRIWVRVPSIPGASTKTIYLYYGNPTASSASDPVNTFWFFDDFTTYRSTNGTWSNLVTEQFGGKYVMSVAGSVETVLTLASRVSDFGVELRYYIASVSDMYDPIAEILLGEERTTRYYGVMNSITTHRMEYFDGSTTTTLVYDGKGYTIGVWYRNYIYRSSTTGKLVGQLGESTEMTATHTALTSFDRIGFATAPLVNKYYVDWVAVRNYADPEPSTSVSTTEEVATIPLSISVGVPVNLTLTATIEPNDTIAPHLYVWYFDGVNDYVNLGTGLTTVTDFTALIWVAIVSHTGFWTGVAGCTLYTDRNWWIVLGAVGSFDISVGVMFTGGGVDGRVGTPGRLVWAHVGLSKSGNTVKGYYNGVLKDVWTGSGDYRLDTRVPLGIGARNGGGYDPSNVMVSQFLFYSSALSDSEIYNVYAYNVVNSSSLALFLDPTFYNGTHYVDLSGLGNHGVGYNNVSRLPDTRWWLYLVKGHNSDGLVHFRFFPVNTRVEIYDASGNLVTSFIITGTPNAAGLVEDYAVSLPAGNYTVKVYTYIDKTVNQNHGLSRYTYIARFSPGDTVRIMWNATDAVALHYQLSTDPLFSTVQYEDIISVSGNYYDLALPSTNNTWYLRARVQLPDGTWSDWSNTASFRTDYLILTASPSRTRADLSTGASASYTVSYSDGATPPALYVNVTAVLTQLGVYTPVDVWWRVDVYSGATTAAEPPGPGYTYRGTAYPLSTHSFFASKLSYVPSGYDSSFVYAGVPVNDAPYWAKSVGAPSTYFALVYQSLVYLPLSGNYTFELVSDDGAKLYVNGTLVIDGWRGAETRSATVSLTAGWYNITIKYWQSYNLLRLLLGVTLPNGTAVKPLRPAYGIQMRPPDTSYSATMPSPPLVLMNIVFSTASRTTPPLGLGTVGLVNVTLQAYDPGAWFNASRVVQLVWDQVVVNSFTPSKPRFTVGDPPSFNITAVYAFDGSPFSGSFTLNDTSTKTNVGAYWYSITGAIDPLYGLTRVSGNTATIVIFDKLVVDSYAFTVNNTTLANNTRVDYTLPINVSVTLKHAYDGLVLDSGNAVRVQLAGVYASWNGSAWVATIQPPGRITAVGHSVVSHAESTLGVRLVDTIIFRVIYDSVNVTYYTSDLAGNTVTLRLVYGYDGALVPSGRACINDSGAVVCGSVSNGYATLSFNRFTNGTVSFINATDGAFVFSNPVKPDKLVVKWVSSDGKISLVGTVDAYYLNHTELPGYFRLACELKGNASILVNTNLTPVLVKVNGSPVSFSYVNNTVLLYNLASTVEVYYSTPVTATTMPGAAPVGAIYEVGFADNPTLENATLRVGVLVNGSSVVPMLWYNGTSYYGSGPAGLSYPLIVAVSWGCEGGTAEVSYMLVYMLGDYTYAAASRHVFTEVSIACPARLYPYIAVQGNVTGVLDKYGGVPSEILKYLATGTLKITVQGPIPAGGMVKYLVLNSPVKLIYTYNGIVVEPGGTAPVTLVGFRGFTLSYSVAGVTVSNVMIARDEFPLEFPYGIALMVVADPSSRTISIVQVAAPAPPVVMTPQTTAPWLAPIQPPGPMQPVFPVDWGAPQFIVLYGAAVAVAILASKLTGSVPRGIMLASLVFGLVLFGVGVFTGNLSALGFAMLAFVVAAAVEIARRHAG